MQAQIPSRGFQSAGAIDHIKGSSIRILISNTDTDSDTQLAGCFKDKQVSKLMYVTFLLHKELHLGSNSSHGFERWPALERSRRAMLH